MRHTTFIVNWSDLKTRQILRKLRIPGAIDDDRTAQLLMSATRAQSPRAAVELIVQRALRPYPAIYATVVARIDLDGDPLVDVTSDLGFSQRSVYRYRATAMRAITHEIGAALSAPAPRRCANRRWSVAWR